MLVALLPLLALWTHTPPPSPVPQVRIIETPPRLVLAVTFKQMCGDRAIDACTKFIGYRLDTRCVSGDGFWNMTGNAEFIPLILLKNPDRYRHERSHIDDVRRETERYLLDLERKTFSTRAACEEEAWNERTTFNKKLYDFAMESNRVRH